MNPNLRCSIAGLLIVSITGLGMQLPAQASLVSTDEAIGARRDRIAAMLDRSDVRAQLEARGVNSSDAKARVAALTDEEVAQLSRQIDALPAGAADPVTAVAGGLAILMTVAIYAIYVVVLLIVAITKGIQASSKTQVLTTPATELAYGRTQSIDRHY